MLHRHPGPFRALLGLLPLLAFSTDTAGAATGGSGSSEEAPTATTTTTAVKEEKAATTTTAPASVAFDATQQAKINDIVAAAKREEAAKYKEAVDKAAEYDKLQEASASERDKAVKEAEKAATKATTERFHGVLIDSKADALAASLGFHSSEVAVATLRSRGALSNIRVDDNGQVDAAAIKIALENLATEIPALVKQAPAPPSAAAAGLGGATGSGDGTQRTREVKPGKDRIEYAYEQAAKKP